VAEQRNTFSGAIAVHDVPRGYPWVDVNHVGTEFAVRTIEAIMLDVGDNADLARAAYSAENEREKPRTTLLARLQAVIDSEEDE
jgi:hypothetical protein